MLAESGRVTALMDVSDGLSTDAARLARSSGVGLVIRASDFPIAEATAAVARELGLDPLELALHGGEDYALLAAVDGMPTEAPSDLHAIGEVIDEPGVWLESIDGHRSPLAPRGWDHTRANYTAFR